MSWLFYNVRRVPESGPPYNGRLDDHSYSRPELIRVRHIELDLELLFDQKILKGAATLVFDPGPAGSLVLDTRDLNIEGTEVSADSTTFADAEFELGASDAILGAPLTVAVPGEATRVRVHYQTSPNASALQWLDPPQTAGKKQPFLFTQSQAIHARSWIPLQDTPGVRTTYAARVRTPKNLTAVMSAEMERETQGGEYRFRMRQPIPSYLIALAAGDLEFRPLGDRTGVYAERPVIERAAREFEDTEQMMQAVEELYGAYRWERYDLLVLPPSFPFGGMENPRLTFATPTILAGDKSLVSLVAHELAHSWSGNLVTNATWRDFWLNEGFTVYLERRIIEKLYGRARAEMEASLARAELEREMEALEERDQILHIDLKGRDPDAGATLVPYEKGALLLRSLEETFGRERFDAFLREYFDHFTFQSITSADFLNYLDRKLPGVQLEEWLYEPGIPAGAPRAKSDALEYVDRQAEGWYDGRIPVRALGTGSWSTQEWLRFLRRLPAEISTDRLAELDRAFSFTQSGNAEIVHQWLLTAIRSGYEPAYARLEEFLTSVGRRKFLKDLYQELVKTAEGRARALAIYQKAKPAYHPIAQATVENIVTFRSTQDTTA